MLNRIIELVCVFALAMASPGCAFKPPQVEGNGDADGGNGSVDGGNGSADSMNGCWTHDPFHFDPCDLTTPSEDLDLDDENEYVYNTTLGLLENNGSSVNHQSQELEGYRVISTTDFRLRSGTILRVIGDMPLVVAASGEIGIEGQIHVNSTLGEAGAGANPDECDTGAPGDGQSDIDGAAGGGGGAFQGAGGNGGNGDSNNGESDGGPGGMAAGIPDRVRGGCPGADGGMGFAGSPGLGGAGGGAIQLTAQTRIRIEGGQIHAGGAGGGGGPGGDNGGGGGGSGGFVGLDAPSVELDGVALAANGGGGGEGAGDTNGGNGQEGLASALPATGGGGSTVFGANGGNGGFRDGPGGLAPVEVTPGGGGGGGGGVGYVLVFTDELEKTGVNVISPQEQDGRSQ